MCFPHRLPAIQKLRNLFVILHVSVDDPFQGTSGCHGQVLSKKAGVHLEESSKEEGPTTTEIETASVRPRSPAPGPV
jgi:hypothetical protein